MLEGSSRTVLITAAAATLVVHASAFTAPSNFGVVRSDFSRPKKSAVYLSGFSPIGSIGLPKTPPTSGDDAIVQDSLITEPVSDDKITETMTIVSVAMEEPPPPIETVEVPKVAAKITRNSSLRMDTISLLSYQMDLEKAAQITAAEIKFEEDTEEEETETETNSPTPESLGMFFVNEILDDSLETSLEPVEDIATETIVEELEDLVMEEIEETGTESVSENSAEDIQAMKFESEDSTENQEIISEIEEITGETLAQVTEEATVEVLEEKSVEEVIDEDKNDDEVIEQDDIAEDTEDEHLETIVDEDTKEEELDTSDEITADVENALIALEAANKAIESTEKMLEKKTAPVEKEESTSQVTQYISKVSDNMKEGDIGERGEQFFIAQAFLVACIGLGTVPMVSGVMEFLAGPVLFLLGTGAIVSAVNELGDGLNPLPKPTSKTELTTTGPYSYVRHPIYSGLLADAFSAGIMTHSAERVLLTLVLLAILNAKVEYEETEMESSVEGYSDYKKSVKGKFFPSNLIEDVFP